MTEVLLKKYLVSSIIALGFFATLFYARAEIAEKQPNTPTPTPTPTTLQPTPTPTVKPKVYVNPDPIIPCTMSKECGGDVRQIKKSECDNMICCLYSEKCGGPKFVNKSKCGDTITCCGLKDGSWTLMDNEQCNKVHDSYKSNTSGNNATQPTANLNYYCYDNTYKYWYYTSSGEQCNSNNAKSAAKELCFSRAELMVWNPCVTNCESKPIEEYSTCIDECSPVYQEARSKCY